MDIHTFSSSFHKPFGAVAEPAEGVVKGAEEARLVAEGFLQMGGVRAAKEEPFEEVLPRTEKIMAETLPKFGKDNRFVEELSLGKEAVPLDPEEAAPPPKVVHVRLASNE